MLHPFVESRNAELAAEVLIREAHKKWRKEEQVIDDITCVILFLEVKV